MYTKDVALAVTTEITRTIKMLTQPTRDDDTDVENDEPPQAADASVFDSIAIWLRPDE